MKAWHVTFIALLVFIGVVAFAAAYVIRLAETLTTQYL